MSKRCDYVCDICNKNYTNWHARYQHIKRIHPEVAKLSSSRQCIELGCTEEYVGIRGLKEHLANTHGFQFHEEEMEFPGIIDFNNWKNWLDRNEKCLFIKNCGKRKTTAKTETTYYYCSRSGSYTSVNTGKRKFRESCKIGNLCTANIVQTVTSYGSVKVSICWTHYGHEVDLKFLRLKNIQNNMEDYKLSNTILEEIGCISQENQTKPNFSDVETCIEDKHKFDLDDLKTDIEKLLSELTMNVTNSENYRALKKVKKYLIGANNLLTLGEP